MTDYIVAYDRQEKKFLLRKLAVADIEKLFGQIKSKDEVDTFMMCC